MLKYTLSRAIWSALIGLLLVLPQSALAATAQFSGVYFTAKESNLGMPILLKAQITNDSGTPLSGKTIFFDIYYNGAWHEINEADNGYTTNTSGIASMYYYVEPTLAPADYQIRARFDGDGTYDKTSLQKALTATLANVTFALFLNGDNNLEPYAVDDFYNELYPQGTNKHVNIIVLFDRISGYSTAQGDWKDTRLFFVSPDSVNSGNYLYSNDWSQYGNELNMGDQEILRVFTETAFTDFPAENKVLVIWDHGNGWEGETSKALALDATDTSVSGTEVELPMPPQVAARLAAKRTALSVETTEDRGPIKSISIDSSSGGDRLSLPEVSGAIEDSGHMLDVLAMDACLMGMVEVAYQVKDVARYYVASADTVDGDGFDYANIVQRIASETTARSLAWDMVDLYKNFYTDDSYQATLAAWDLMDMDPLFSAMETLSTTFLDRMDQIPYAERSALRSATENMIDEQEFYDIGSLVHHIQQEISDPLVKATAQALEDRIVEAVRVNYWIHSGTRFGYAYSNTTGMTGLTLYWPLVSGFNSDYTNPNVLSYANQSWNKAVRLLLDGKPPTTSVVQWITAPQAVDDSSISMTSFTATDQLGNTVYYQFTFTQSPTGGGGGSDSTNRYTSTTYTDQGLEPNHQYCYTVYAHDGAGNQTGTTFEECAVTRAQTPGTGIFSGNQCDSITVSWDPLNNPEGTQYYCENTTLGTNSGWITTPLWQSTGLSNDNIYSFRVKARNRANVETNWRVLDDFSTGLCTGDINDDSHITVADAILCLQVAAGMNPQGVRKSSAIDALQQIGLDEALYILQIEGDSR
ncbi:MAG: peptidase C11 [Desulfatibacillum sp.]|nr:peptidase C11 [Desulfatibacillum sp.]